MTVATVDTVIEHVVDVAELNRLLEELVGAGHIRGATKQHGQQDETCGQHQCAGETELGNGIGAAMEDLRHLLMG